MVKTSEQQAVSRLSEGRELLQAGDLKGALVSFDEVIALDPSPMILSSAHLNRLDALRKLGRHEEAAAA